MNNAEKNDELLLKIGDLVAAVGNSSFNGQYGYVSAVHLQEHTAYYTVRWSTGVSSDYDNSCIGRLLNKPEVKQTFEIPRFKEAVSNLCIQLTSLGRHVADLEEEAQQVRVVNNTLAEACKELSQRNDALVKELESCLKAKLGCGCQPA